MNSPRTSTIDVLVIGAGPTGLALGHDLHRRGVRCLIVEQSTHRVSHPKAKFVNLRSMTILRRWGLADLLARAAPLPPDYPADVHYVTALTGEVLGSAPGAFPTTAAQSAPYPVPALRIPQPDYEQVLEDALSGSDLVSVRRGWRLDGLRQSPEGVRAEITDVSTGRGEEIHAQFLVAADGARSTTRTLIGATMTGAGAIAHSLGATFRSTTLAQKTTAGRAVHYWVVNQALPATPGFGPLDLNGRWFFQAMGVPPDLPATARQAAAIIATAIGDDTPFEVDDVAPWTVHHLQADRYRSGRVILIGDTVHLHPPTGGFGMNMGLADAVDVGWKITAVLRGWGGPHLLGSYETERRPVHTATMATAVRNFHAVDLRGIYHLNDDRPTRARKVTAMLAEPRPRYFDSIAIQLGYRYDTSPLVSGEPGDSQPQADEQPQTHESQGYEPSAAPGRVLPHAWIDEHRSTLDVVGDWFTVLAYADSDTRAVQAQARTWRTPLQVVRYHRAAVRQLLGADLVLVRPDQHVAWRGSAATQAARALPTAIGHDATS